MGQKLKQDISIGKNIRKIRKSRDLTQDQLACKLQLIGCDISRGSLAKIEAGIQNIRVSELKAIRQVLETSYENIFQ